MKARKVSCIEHIQYNNKNYTVMVYGELKDVKEINGFAVIPVKFNGKCEKVRDVDTTYQALIPGFNQFYSKTKEFNMGWSICAEPDEFDFETGMNICKRRFSKSPITTQNGRFLTLDMCQAIVDNEVKYVIENISSYLPNENLGTNYHNKPYNKP